MAQREIVVVGASAGGVEALKTLIGGFPTSMTASIFVVLHIPADATSRLHEVLGANSALPVEPASEGAPIMPGRIGSSGGFDQHRKRNCVGADTRQDRNSEPA